MTPHLVVGDRTLPTYLSRPARPPAALPTYLPAGLADGIGPPETTYLPATPRAVTVGPATSALPRDTPSDTSVRRSTSPDTPSPLYIHDTHERERPRCARGAWRRAGCRPRDTLTYLPRAHGLGRTHTPWDLPTYLHAWSGHRSRDLPTYLQGVVSSKLRRSKKDQTLHVTKRPSLLEGGVYEGYEAHVTDIHIISPCPLRTRTPEEP